jgi:hyperosmotically inducible protein
MNIMKTRKQILGMAGMLAVATATSLLGGCSSGDRYSQSTGEYIDDANITRHVKSALGDDVYKYPDVSVTTFKGQVQLSGFVNERSQKDRAGTIAKDVPGAHEVINNISVKSSQGSGQFVDDSTLTRRVKDVLGDDVYKYPDVKVATANGTVQLSGFVNEQAQKDNAGKLAKSVPGVKDVINNITVKSGE